MVELHLRQLIFERLADIVAEMALSVGPNSNSFKSETSNGELLTGIAASGTPKNSWPRCR